MAETFIQGEIKTRPGSYFNIQKGGDDSETVITKGITAVLFRSNRGPLNKAVEIGSDEDYTDTFGTALTTDAIQEAISGGASTIIACRVGNGGTAACINVNDTEGAQAVSITTKYPGNVELSVTIREKLSDSGKKECIFYEGTRELETVEFASGEGEAQALVTALKSSMNFEAEIKEGKEKALLAAVSQSAFEKGTDPLATVEDYANAFSEVESCIFNTICIDTEEPQVIALLQSFIDRIFDDGYLAQAVVAEKKTVDLEKRIKNAASFNDEKMIYVLNANVDEKGTEIDGYQTAARIAGMVGAASATTSLTHTTISGFTELKEKMKKSEIEKAEENGCLVLSYNKNKQVWIDNAINTLVTLPENMDKGWKKIRRVNTRFELIDRLNQKNDDMVGKIDVTDTATVILKLQEVGDAMIQEGKITYFAVTESENKKANGDSAWFDYDVIDKDSMEHIYGTFKFRYNTTNE